MLLPGKDFQQKKELVAHVNKGLQGHLDAMKPGAV
jgi:hypothetical protein